jgi:hypothetical protein
MISAGFWVKNLRKDGYCLLIDALIRHKIPPQPFGTAAVAAMHARVGKRRNSVFPTVKPRDLQAAVIQFVEAPQLATSLLVNPLAVPYTVAGSSRPSSMIDPTMLGGTFPEIFGTPKRPRLSSPTNARRTSNFSEPAESSPAPTSECSHPSSPTQPIGSLLVSPTKRLTPEEREALQRIAMKTFGASVFTTEVHTIRWLDSALAGFPGDPSVSSLIALEMHTFRSQQRPLTHTVLQQLLRQDLGLWALAALALDDYRLLAVAVPCELDLCCNWKDKGTVVQVCGSGQHSAQYFWLGTNIHFVAGSNGSILWDIVRKVPAGTYFHQTPQGILKNKPTRGLQPIPEVTLLNPISQALVGKADWEDAVVNSFVSKLFAVSADDDALEYQVDMHARSAVLLAFEGSWLSVLTVSNRKSMNGAADILDEVLAADETCISDDQVVGIRNLARRYGIGS